MSTCFDCGSVTGAAGKRRCAACEHWNIGMTRRIISAVKEGSTAMPEVFGTLTTRDAESTGTDLVVDIDGSRPEIGEFNDFIVIM